jgi:hypothetical protein
MRILDRTSHGKNLKNSSQINGSRVQQLRKCIELKMS